MRAPNGLELLLNGARGIYIPQAFAEFTGWNISDEDRAILLSGPDHELYWDAWSDVLDSVQFTVEYNGKAYIYRLHQDGDLWAYCRERMTPQEQIDFFGDYDPPENTIVYMVGSHFAYDDETALNDIEIEQLAQFMQRESPAYPHLWTVEPALSDEFGLCEITGERGRLVGLLLVDMRNKGE